MTLIRYNPWQDINSLQRQLNSLFDDALTGETWKDFNNVSKIPPAELSETDDALILKLEVPGIKPQDLDIQVMVDKVIVKGERKAKTETKTEAKTRSEFRYGEFSRAIPLPVQIQNTKVTVNHENGILELTLPKSEAAKNKVVKISLDGTSEQAEEKTV